VLEASRAHVPRDGAAVAFVHDPDLAVWSAPIDGSKTASRMFFDRGQDSDLTWSPRGDLIAFVAPNGMDAGLLERLWVVPLTGEGPRCLTSNFDQAVGENGDVDVEGHPALSDFLRYHEPYYEKLHERRLRVDAIDGVELAGARGDADGEAVREVVQPDGGRDRGLLL